MKRSAHNEKTMADFPKGMSIERETYLLLDCQRDALILSFVTQYLANYLPPFWRQSCFWKDYNLVEITKI